MMCGQYRSHRKHAGKSRDSSLAGTAQRFALATALGIDFDHEANIAVAENQTLNDVLLYDAAPADRIDDLVERLEYFIARRVNHRKYPGLCLVVWGT